MLYKASKAAVGFAVTGLVTVLIFSAARLGGVEVVGVFMMLPAVILALLIVTSDGGATSL